MAIWQQDYYLPKDGYSEARDLRSLRSAHRFVVGHYGAGLLWILVNTVSLISSDQGVVEHFGLSIAAFYSLLSIEGFLSRNFKLIVRGRHLTPVLILCETCPNFRRPSILLVLLDPVLQLAYIQLGLNEGFPPAIFSGLEVIDTDVSSLERSLEIRISLMEIRISLQELSVMVNMDKLESIFNAIVA